MIEQKTYIFAAIQKVHPLLINNLPHLFLNLTAGPRTFICPE
jgi:hypothetical protein